jgi:hypothetical protein
MPRKSTHRSKSSRPPAPEAQTFETPRILSPDEKRELILAHAAMRSPQDPFQRFTMWSGIAVSVIALVGGWWLTVGWSVQRAMKQGNQDLRNMTTQLDEFTKQAKTNPLLSQPIVPSTTSNAQAADLAENLKMLLEQASSTPRTDLLSPNAPSTSSTAVAGTSTKPIVETPVRSPFIIDPNTPGLTTDPESAVRPSSR